MRDLYTMPSINHGNEPIDTFNVLFLCTFNASEPCYADRPTR
jgi:hypothetical protein